MKNFFLAGLLLANIFFSATYASVLVSPEKLNALKTKFDKEEKSIRDFRANGMINKYYQLKKEQSPEAEKYLGQIIFLFPDYVPAKLEYAIFLEKKGDLRAAQQYLLKIKATTDHARLDEELEKIDIELYKKSFYYERKITVPLTIQICQFDYRNLPVQKKITQSTPAVVPSVLNEYTRILNEYYGLKKTDAKNACAFLEDNARKKGNQLEKDSQQYYCYAPEENKKNYDAPPIKLSEKCQHIFSFSMETGYCLLNQKKQKASLSYFFNAQRIEPKKYDIAMQIGYIQSAIGKNKKAYSEFQYAAHAPDPKIQSQAEVSQVNLSEYKFKLFPDPLYFDLYTEPYYYSRFDDFIKPLQARLGLLLGKHRQYDMYFNYRRSTDTASNSGGIAPQIYNDNFELIGAGFRYFPFTNMPLFAYSEYGLAHSLTDQPTYPNTEEDYRGGMVYGNRWGAPAQYHLHPLWELRPWADTYENVSYYSRYENWIGQLTGRFATEVLQWRHFTVSPYIKVQTFFDSQRLFFNNIFEYGPGIQIQPDNKVNFIISYEHIFGVYIPVPNNSSNPYGPSYDTNIVRVIFYVRI